MFSLRGRGLHPAGVALSPDDTRTVFDVVKRLLVGRPLRSARLGDTLLPKRIALPVFCSDPISSVAYATEQIVLVLAAGGLVALRATPWVGLVVVLLLVTVVASYRQTCFAYPSGGGAYVVSKENLGESASLAAAAALLVDYVMTVAVSVTSGVVAVTSAVPTLSRHSVALSVGLIVLLTVANLRGTRAGVRGADVRVRRADGADVRLGGDRGAHARPPAGGDGDHAGRAVLRADEHRADRAAGAGLRLRVHGADRGGGDQQRGAVVREAQGP
jgi:hypothetical protein